MVLGAIFLDLADEHRVEHYRSLRLEIAIVPVKLIDDNKIGHIQGMGKSLQRFGRMISDNLVDRVPVSRGHVHRNLKSHGSVGQYVNDAPPYDNDNAGRDETGAHDKIQLFDIARLMQLCVGGVKHDSLFG